MEDRSKLEVGSVRDGHTGTCTSQIAVFWIASVQNRHTGRAPASLLVLQGDNDPRVPKEEAQQVVDILKKDGRID